MRIVFMGTPEFGVPTFNRLIEQGHTIVACYTQPPRPSGRGQKEKISPVHLAAQTAGVPVFTPRSLKGEGEQNIFASHNADLAVVVAYGLILPKAILNAPRYGCLNLHGSALPRWRGAAPIQRAIMAGDAKTAIQVMAMEEGLDTGAVCFSASIDILDQMTAGDLHDRMMDLGADIMIKAIEALENGDLRFTPQDDIGVTYAKKIDKAEAHIDWNMPAVQLHNLIRGLSPSPGAWSEFHIKGKQARVKFLRTEVAQNQGIPGEILGGELCIACGQGALRITQVQRAGKGPMSAKEFLRGAGDLSGRILSSKKAD